MLKHKIILGATLLIAFNCGSASAQNGESHQISDRIKALRERLNVFTSRDGSKTPQGSQASPEKTTPPTPVAGMETQSGSVSGAQASARPVLPQAATPDQESESIENSKEAKVILLFHDGSSTEKKRNASPSGVPEKMSEGSESGKEKTSAAKDSRLSKG